MLRTGLGKRAFTRASAALRPNMRLMGTLPALKGAANRSIFSFPLLSKAAAATTTTTRNYSKTTDGKHAPEEVDALSINEFHRISEDYLELLTDHLVDLGQDFPQVDAEYSHGVMSLELPPNGSYVINKQPPNKQIWLSSPVSGPDRFDPIGGKWISLRTQESLGDVLRREIKIALDFEAPLEGIDDE